VVNNLYQRYLKRAPEPGGLSTSLAFLQGGGTDEQLAAIITGSPEYFQVHGNTNDAFLAALYQDALNRPIDPVGQAEFTQLLNTGTTRGQVAAVIFSSTEYHQDLVQSFYQRFLDRVGEDSAVAGWVALLQKGTTDEQVIAGIEGSAESFVKTAP
jgi:hypothetical protein